MVSADELPRGGKGLKIESRLNGKTMQSSNTDNFMFPGGGIAGLSHRGHDAGARQRSSHRHAVRRRPRAQARAGVDEAGRHLRVEIAGIGVLRNPIEDEKA